MAGAQRRLFDNTPIKQHATPPAVTSRFVGRRHAPAREASTSPGGPPSFVLCQVVVPGIAGHPPQAPLQLRTDAARPLHNLGARVAEEIECILDSLSDRSHLQRYADWRIYFNGREVQLAHTPIEVGMNVGQTLNVLQVDFAEYIEEGRGVERHSAISVDSGSGDTQSIVSLQVELKEALGHLDVLKWRVDSHADQLSQEKTARVSSDDTRGKLTEHINTTNDSIDALIAKYTAQPFAV